MYTDVYIIYDETKWSALWYDNEIHNSLAAPSNEKRVADNSFLTMELGIP